MSALALMRPVVAALVLVGCAASPRGEAVAEPLADGSAESVAAAVEKITTFPTELDPRLWNGTDLKPEVRERSLAIVDRILADSGYAGLRVDAVELFGSNASYEYDDSSDYGIHVFTESTGPASPEELKRTLPLLNDYVERRQEGRITFNGVVVEVTFHSERTENYRPSPGIGQYSVSAGRWIEPPVQQPDAFDRATMTTDMTAFIDAYNDLVVGYAADIQGFDCSRFGDLDAEISAYRNSGFSSSLGSRSTQNLTYRALRRINVSIPDMVDTLEDECIFKQESIG
jgi:hypothetical protein